MSSRICDKNQKKQQKPTHPKPGAKKLLIKQTKPPNKDNHRKLRTANRTVPVAEKRDAYKKRFKSHFP